MLQTSDGGCTKNPPSVPYTDLREYFKQEFCYEGRGAPVEEWPRKLADGCIEMFEESLESYQVASIDGIRGIYNPYEHGHPVTLIRHNGTIYEFHLANTQETGGFPSEDHQRLFDRILSTFLFLDMQAPLRELDIAELEQVSPDSDQDGLSNILDNCTFIYNPDQTDRDNDGEGDVCEKIGKM